MDNAMITDALAELHTRLPKMNEIICEGLAYHQSKDGGIYRTVDGYLKAAFRREGGYDGEGLPDGLKYQYLRRLTPREEVLARMQVTKSSPYNRKAGYDLSNTSTVLVKAVFENDGDIFERPIAIPFILYGNMTYIRNTKYGVSNVMKTRGLSLTPKGFFVEFPRHKVQFETLIYHYEIDGLVEHVLMPTASNLHAKTTRRTFKPIVVGWLLARYGVSEMFRRFAGHEITVFASDSPALRDIDQDTYAICRAPAARRGLSCQIVIVVPRARLTPAVKVLIGGVLYIASDDPVHMTIEEVNKLERWQIMLGYMIHGKSGAKSPIHVLEEIQTHLTSIERFMDAKFKGELASVDLQCNDIYEFLYCIIEATTQKSASESRDIANLNGRFLSPIDYMLRDLRKAIFDTMYNITRSARKEKGKVIPTKQVKQEIDRGIPMNIVTKMNTDHGEMAPFMSACDNVYLAQTANCIDQTEARKSTGKSGASSSLTDPSKHVHSSFVYIGCVNWLPKSSPYGTSRINPYLILSIDGRLACPQRFADDMRKLQIDLDMKGF